MYDIQTTISRRNKQNDHFVKNYCKNKDFLLLYKYIY